MTPRVDVPEPGFYQTRLVKGGPFVPVKIWYGAPLDPVTNEELDRSPRWHALRNGTLVDIWDVWPGCSGGAISEAEYGHLIGVAQWAMNHAPSAPEANPTKPIDLHAMPPVF